MIKIGNVKITSSSPTFIIAEIAQAHDGSLGYAHSFIDIAKKCGVDAVKFQMHYAEYESTINEKFRIPLSSQYKNRFEYWKKMEFSKEQWLELKKHCDELDLEFMLSVFSHHALFNAKKLGLNNIKISSGEIFNKPLIDEASKNFLNIIFSTGMLRKREINEYIKFFKKNNNNLGVLHCVSKYPVKKKELSIDFIDTLKSENSNLAIGYSDHSGEITPAIYALSKRINILELHLAMHKNQYGPDTDSSILPQELELICKIKNDLFVMYNQCSSRDKVIDSIRNKHLFTRSLSLLEDKTKGDIISANDLILKKPGTGIPHSEKDAVIGKKLIKKVSKNRLLRYDDFID